MPADAYGKRFWFNCQHSADYRRWRAFNAILKTSGLADTLAVILSNLDMHPILLAWLVALILHAAVGSATVAMMGATAIVAPMLPLYPGVSPEIIAIAIGSGAIGCTIVTDSLFWLVKQYCGASPQRDVQILYHRDLYRFAACTGRYIPAFLYHLSAKRRNMENADMTTLLAQLPLLEELITLKETTWFNPSTTSLAEGLPYVGLTTEDVQDAHARLDRFAPLSGGGLSGNRRHRRHYRV